jgi:hypothetical protein
VLIWSLILVIRAYGGSFVLMCWGDDAVSTPSMQVRVTLSDE